MSIGVAVCASGRTLGIQTTHLIAACLIDCIGLQEVAAMVANKQLAVTKKLGKELLLSRAHVNNAPLLLATLTSSLQDSTTANAAVLKEALLSLQAFFVPLVKSGDFSPAAQKRASEELQRVSGTSEADGGNQAEMAKADAIYKKWIWDRYREFVTTLLRFVARHNAIPEVQVHIFSNEQEPISSWARN